MSSKAQLSALKSPDPKKYVYKENVEAAEKENAKIQESGSVTLGGAVVTAGALLLSSYKVWAYISTG